MSVKSELHKIWKRLSDPEFRAFRRQIKAFRAAHGRGTPDQYSGLKAGEVVLDVGGYHGDWAQQMTVKYGVTAHVFEPHPRFVDHLNNRFAGRDDVHVHGFAIGAVASTLNLSDDENASSALVTGGVTVPGVVRPVTEVFEEEAFSRIAVVKMNIEGGEYDLLPALFEAGLMARIDRLTVQFHRYSEAQVAARDAIRRDLENTHDCVWCYPFIWEEWVRKPA